MRRLLKGVLCLCLLPAAAGGACPPAGTAREELLALKAAAFEVPDDARRNALALDLLDCLSDPDPLLRDGVAFEAMAHWLRGDRLAVATRTQLLDAAGAVLRAPPDAAGVHQPFAALVLSEVARTDRIAAWMTPAQRTALVQAAADYLRGVRDYRGFDPREGWRHGVAHGADLVLQLGLNPALDRGQLDLLLDALGRQVAPPGEHAYVDGESERLARAFLYIAQRGLHDAAFWRAWLTELAGPGPLASWDDAFRSRAGLARRHNLAGFLRAAYVGARESGDARMEQVLAGLREALKAMP